MGVLVIPDQVAVTQAHSAFDDHGNLLDAKRQTSVQGLGRSVVKLVGWNR
jgi:hypothetical protein